MKARHAIGLAATLVGAALLATLAMPVTLWRTGDQGLEQPTYERSTHDTLPVATRRLWIDADAACGHGRRTDPDDCLAIALLLRAPGVEVVGISTVFGNAPREVVDHTTSELVAMLAPDRARSPPRVFGGSARPLPADASHHAAPAHDALTRALEQGPLTIVALGPLTNVAAALGRRPDLASRVHHLVAVMGRRPGHLFHPAEGAHAGTFLGHGPVFRDFNVVMDPRAAEQVFAMNLPASLIPYDAARGIELTGADLDALARAGAAGAWLARRARGWLDHWQHDIGRRGFFPFDLLAAAYVVEPRQFECARIHAWVGKDTTLFVPLWHPTALLVRRHDPGAARDGAPGAARKPTRYCARVAADIETTLMRRLTG